MGKCCHCCSFDSLSCRLRTLKALGALLLLLGAVFTLAGIAIGFLSDLYFQAVSLPDVFPQYILFAFLVISTGVVASGTGMAAIYIARTMSDDDCSPRGLSVLALLTIVCSLATVGVPAWRLYENGYFLEIPPQTTMNMTTSFAATTSMPVPDAITTVSTIFDNSNATAANGTSMDMNGTVSQMNATMNATSMDNNSTVSSNSTSNETMSMDASGANMTMQNMTSDNANMTMPNMTSDSTNMTMPNTTSGNTNMTMSNMTSDNSTQSMSSPDSNNTVTSDAQMTTPDVMTGTTGNYTTGNSTETNVTREPIDYDEWLLIIVPFGIICFFALIFVLFGFFIFCIACCCPERSEIVDDIDLYKS